MKEQTKKILEFCLEVPAELNDWNSIKNLPKLYQAVEMFYTALGAGLKKDIDSCLDALKTSLLKKKKADSGSVDKEVEKCRNEIIERITNLYTTVFNQAGLQFNPSIGKPAN